MKWVLIFVLICVIMIIAKSLSEQYADRYDFYYNLKQFLTRFKLNLSFRQTKIMEFINSLKPKKQFRLFIESYKNYLNTSSLNLSTIKILETEDKQVLEDIVKNTGKLDSQNEINQIDSFLCVIDSKLTKAEQDKNKICPLILKLSFLLAVGLAILLV